jgi:hypothetical protein
MRLVRLGQGRWTIYAACRANGSCPILEFIAGLPLKRRRKVLSDLQQFVAQTDRADWARCDFSKKLNAADDIYEFCWPTHGGGTPRVFWFFDAGYVIVCTHGLDKKGALPAADIRAAEAMKAAYLTAKNRGTFDIVDVHDFDTDDNEPE